MKKQIILFLILTLICSPFTFAQAQNNSPKGLHYIITDSAEEEVDGEETYLQIYNEDKRRLLHYKLKSKEGDCNSESLEISTYEWQGEYLVFYTFWCTRGDAPVSPYGARVQKYRYTDDALVLDSGSIYIETSRLSYSANTGVQYLEKEAKTSEEKEALTTYIKQTEKDYQATFVPKEERAALIALVKRKLEKEIAKETKGWLEHQNGFGIRM